MEETLRREVSEEINTTILSPVLLGYQQVDEGEGKEPYAQVRMVALIDHIGQMRSDIDTGQTYRRLLVLTKRANELLRWGQVGAQQIAAAVEVIFSLFIL